MTLVLLFLATCFLAYSNGANDNFKGVASLFGSRTCNYRTAISWATITTFAGSIMSIFLAQTLLKKFTGKGIVPDHFVGSEYFLLAVAIGAGVTVIIATLTGFPISTTHALTGAIIGCGLVALGSQVNLAALGNGFVLPLLLSPILAIAVAALLYILFRALRIATGVTKEWCVCVGTEKRVVAMPQPSSALALRSVGSTITLSVDEQENCRERYAGSFLGLGSQQIMDAAHFLSAGTVSFARGLNDTPKIVALLLLWKTLDVRWGFAAVASAIAIGGLLNARKVADTMSRKITVMNHGQGFTANLTTALLVVLASLFGLPVSTTHVSVGSLFGIGLTTGKANPRVIRAIVSAWLITLPCAAIISGTFYWVATSLNS
ncbi:MAG TPA: anion permease [Candidatus Udaeobacter sp.]|jgi:PiT family inorganic phosphate transporter|nr:anion permease [Candidatus Udaeobacter sp.]